MKKVLLVAALAVFGLSANAQDINFGAKAGANFANITGDAYENADMKIGLHIGVLAEYMLSNKFAIQGELLYSMQGSKFEESALGFSYESTTKLDYITVPILAKYYFTEGFSAHLGPQLGFLMSAKEDIDTNVPGEESGEIDIKDGLKSLDFGLAVGAGYKLESGLFFSARYYFGLADLPDTDADVDMRNSNIQVSVGYMF